MIKKLIKKLFAICLSPFIIKDYVSFMMKHDSRFKLSPFNFYPQIKDKTISTNFDRHYVYHTSWAARKLQEIKPKLHIDISSSLYFCGIASAFTPIDFYDYRPADISLSGLHSKKGDLMNLPFETNSVQSISCMHTIEHIGLGRYGDVIDPNGDLKAIAELRRVVSKGGNLIFVVPIGGVAIIEFNAHRIYTYDQIVSYFPDFELREFSLIPEHGIDGGIIQNVSPSLVNKEKYACGCFWFVKK